MNSQYHKGFIALMSSIIISIILLTLVVTVSASTFYARFDALGGETKRESLSLAESCMNMALLRLAQNPLYQPAPSGDTIAVGSKNCIIDQALTTSPGYPKTFSIKTHAGYLGTWSNALASVTVQDPTVSVFSHGALFVVTRVVNDNGGTALPSSFTMNVTGGSPSAPTFAGSATGVLVTLSAGVPYTVTQSTSALYNQSASSDCSGTLLPGEVKTCVFSNDDKPTTGKLTLIANVVNGYGGTKTAADFPLFVDGVPIASGIATTVAPGAHIAMGGVIAGYATSSPKAWGADCGSPGTGSVSLLAGDTKTCVIVYSDIPSASPACVDTVLMFAGFEAGGLTEETIASKAFIDYAAANSPSSLISVGSFGGIDGAKTALIPSPAATPPYDGRLMSPYGNNGSVASTSAMFPTTSAAPNQWKTPANAFTNDTTFATSSVVSDKQGLGTFALIIPAGATIKGVEVVASGKVTPYALNAATVTPTAIAHFDQWSVSSGTNNAANRLIAGQAQGGTYLTSSVAGNAETFTVANAVVPAGATINSVTMYAIVANSGGVSSSTLRVENGVAAANIKDGTGYTLNSGATTTISRQMLTNPFTGLAWTQAEVTNWTTKFGIMRTNNTGVGATPRLDQIYVVVNYTPAPSGTVGVDLSWNAGGTWTAAKSATLTGSDAPTTLGASNDLWGRGSWTIAEFSDANFIVRLTNTSALGLTTGVNYASVRVYYTLPPSGLYATLDKISTTIGHSDGNDVVAAITVARAELESARHRPLCNKNLVLIYNGANNGTVLTTADNAKLSGINIFTIQFGNPANHQKLELVANIASGTYPVAGHRGGSTDDHSGNALLENADGDNFFIAPDTASFAGIFNQLAAVTFIPSTPPPPPSTGRISVMTHVDNVYGGVSLASDFAVAVTAINPSSAAFTGAESPGISITIDPGAYSIDETLLPNYVKNLGVECSGSILAGETKTCIITNSDIPPPPPPIPLPPDGISLGSWDETPSTTP